MKIKLYNSILFLFYILICLTNRLESQELNSKALITKGLVFENIFTNNGLPDNRIRSIYQSKRGYLWIGTMNGLAKYDGYSFINYSKQNDGKGIAGNWVYDITEDAFENIWIGSTSGVSKLDISRDTIINYTSSKYLTNKEVRSLYIDNNQRIWIGTKKGLSIIFNSKTEDVLKFKDQPFNNAINSIIQDKRGFVWVSCETGLARFNPKDLSYVYLPLLVKSNPYGDKIWDLYYLKNKIWIGTGGDGVYQVTVTDSLKNSVIEKFKHNKLNNIEVFDIKEGPEGKIWLATGKGLGRVSLEKKGDNVEFFNHQNNNKYSISNDLLYKLHFDTSKNLWIGSDMGLNALLFKNLNFENYFFNLNKDKDAIRGITSTNENNIVVASASKGFYEVDKKKSTYNKVPIINSNYKIQLCRSISSFEDIIFTGTLDGVLIKNLKTGEETHVLSGKNIFSLAKDPFASIIYIGAIDGLYMYDIKTSKLISNVKKINGFVRSLSFSMDGSLWVGVDGPTLYVKKNKETSFKEIHIPKEFEGFEINAIDHDTYGNTWLGTQSGLNKLFINSQGDFGCEFFDESHGLIDKMVNGVIVDGDNIWLSTIKGITKFNIKEKCSEYYLSNLIFSPSSFYKQNDNSFLFGHAEGFIKFNPNNFLKKQELPNIQITSLLVSNKKVETRQQINGDKILENKIENTESITLNHKNNIFTLEYADLNGSFDNNRQYLYKLEGFDKNWNQNKGNQHSATYTNLDPGKYIFMVKTKNQGDLDHVRKLELNILSPPWKSWWAILIYILLLLSIIFLFFRFRLENINKENLLILEKKEKEQIQHLNNQKLQFFTDISHEFRTPVTLISGPIKDIINNPSISIDLRKKARIIEKNSDKLIYLIDELITFRKLGQGQIKLKLTPVNLLKFAKETANNFRFFAESKEVFISCHSSSDDNMIMLDPQQFYKVINNLIFNALKFCPNNSVIAIKMGQVKKKLLTKKHLAIDPQWVYLEIIDQGGGIPKKDIKYLFDRFYKGKDVYAGTGIGLSIVKEIVELHQGFIEVKSDPKETCFIVMFPKGTPEAVEVSTLKKQSFYTQNLKPESLLISETIDFEKTYGKTFGDYEKKNILLIDDNSELLEYLHMILKQDYHIDLALNGKEALKVLENKKPDLIVSDVIMPKMDGIELCKQIRSNPKTKHIPIILLSAKTMSESKISGIKAGADDYLEKPFHSEVLKAKIYSLIKSRDDLQQNNNSSENYISNLKDVNRNPIEEKFLQKVIDLINKNLENENFSVEELSDELSMSRSNLFRKIKQLTEMSPVSFIYYIRLQKAVQLLLDRKFSVSEIAWKVGYKNPASFSKSFRKQYGKSPTEYLNEIINNK